MLKQITFTAIAIATLTGTTLVEAVAFPVFMPNAVLAAAEAGERKPLVADTLVPVSERAPMVVRIGDRAHLFDGYFYCERPATPLPKGLEAFGQHIPKRTLSFLAR